MLIEFEDIHGFRVAINPNRITRISEGGNYTYIELTGDSVGYGINVKGEFEEVLELLNT